MRLELCDIRVVVITHLREAGRGKLGSLAVVGSGVVGTATGEGLVAKGYDVLFCDVSPDRLRSLRGRGHRAVEPEELPGNGIDVFLISVPSPTIDGVVELEYVRLAAEAVGRAIRASDTWPLVVVRSTVPPGTTDGLVASAVARASGRALGRGFGLCMNPEFLREASAFEDFEDPRVIVIGAHDSASEQVLRTVYAPWAEVPIVAMSLRGAEMTKYTSNLFNATKISFFNEMEQVCRELDVDTRSIFDAVALGAEGLWNPSYGTRRLQPYGGTCLPKDTVGFLGFVEASDIDADMYMLRATIATNERLSEKPNLVAPSREQVHTADAL